MRIGFWKLFTAFGLLLVTAYLLNPLGVPSQDPRARLFGIAPYTIPGQSMTPTLKPGDVVIASSWAYALGEPQRGDLVIFQTPHLPGVKFLQRLMGLPGDRLAMRAGRLFINGKAIDEPYLNPDQGLAQPSSLEMAERLVPEGEFFMLGDNRKNSNDSRYWGTVERQKLIGRVEKVL
nr:signal peptidase I [uncultured Pseudomonas sp.]